MTSFRIIKANELNYALKSVDSPQRPFLVVGDTTRQLLKENS